MTEKFYNALGLSRRAGKLCIGHDDVKASLKSGKARLVLLTADASDRLKREMERLADGVPVLTTDATMDDMATHIGKRAGLYSVTDEGLKNLILSTIKEDSIHGTSQ